jgi:hypothetical protein
MASKPTLELEMEYEKETKKTIRFTEIQDPKSAAEAENPHKFYLSKTRWAKMGEPQKVNLRLEAGE